MTHSLETRLCIRRAPRAAVVAVVLLALGCSSPDERGPLVIDCAADDAYSFQTLTFTWWTAGDGTVLPGAMRTPDPAVPLETQLVEARCEGDTSALNFYAGHYQDWGSIFGTPVSPADASTAAGLSFWARASYDKSFLIGFDDRYTAEAGGICMPAYSAMSEEQVCGNSFETYVVVKEWWDFYTIPFHAFIQQPRPNRRPDGIDRSAIVNMILRAHKDSVLDLWLDQVAWYTPTQ